MKGKNKVKKHLFMGVETWKKKRRKNEVFIMVNNILYPISLKNIYMTYISKNSEYATTRFSGEIYLPLKEYSSLIRVFKNQYTPKLFKRLYNFTTEGAKR